MNRVFIALTPLIVLTYAGGAMLSAAAALPQTAGEAAFKASCGACHTTIAGPPRMGPQLSKIAGRKAGSLPGYSYSRAMQKASIRWDESTLDRFIQKPAAMVPSTKMAFSGLSDQDRRKAIVQYLMQQN